MLKKAGTTVTSWEMFSGWKVEGSSGQLAIFESLLKLLYLMLETQVEIPHLEETHDKH
jgi:hypothetical protein